MPLKSHSISTVQNHLQAIVHQSFSSGRSGTCSSEWTTRKSTMYKGKTVSHCPRLTRLWTSWLEPNGSPLWTGRAVIGRWICIRTTRRRLRSRRVKNYDSSQSCPLSSATPQQRLERLLETVLRNLA
jgi:hypothetical protein